MIHALLYRPHISCFSSIRRQSQIEDLLYLSEQYEQQEAERMIRASGNMYAARMYINAPIPVQQRNRS